jgi:hypothetical protein
LCAFFPFRVKALIAVPKSEIDERQAQYQRAKKTAKKRSVFFSSFINISFLICCSAAIAPSLITTIRAQQTCVGIEGRATTAEGWMIPMVKIRLLNKNTKQSTNVETKENGQYTACLAPGLYDVTAMAPGFKTAKRKAIKVENAVKSIIDFPMKRGAPTTSHERNGQSSILLP